MICMMSLLSCVVVGLADNYNDLISVHRHTPYQHWPSSARLHFTPHTSRRVQSVPSREYFVLVGNQSVMMAQTNKERHLMCPLTLLSSPDQSEYFYILPQLHVEHQSPPGSPPRLAERYIGITWHRHNKLNWQKLTQGEKINFHLFPLPVRLLPVLAASCARKCSEIRKTEAGKVFAKMPIIVLHYGGCYLWSWCLSSKTWWIQFLWGNPWTTLSSPSLEQTIFTVLSQPTTNNKPRWHSEFQHNCSFLQSEDNFILSLFLNYKINYGTLLHVTAGFILTVHHQSVKRNTGWSKHCRPLVIRCYPGWRV